MNKIIKLDLNLREKINKPVIIKKIKVVNYNKQLYVKTISQNGNIGLLKANNRLKFLLPLLENLVIPFFINKDARNIESLVSKIYRYKRNYKYSGLPFWNCVGHVELSLWDLMGRTVKLPVNKLVGNVVRKEIPVYLTRFNRDISPEEEVAQLPDLLAEYGYKAVKVKIGGRMSQNKDVSPGYTEKLIKLLKDELSDDIMLYVDANGSYDASKAINVGRMLEKYGVKFFEEPCPWEDFMGTKKVAEKLNMMVAGGEQDTNLYKFKWMIENKCVNLIQPDLLYNGGLVRCLQVSKMAKKAGIKIAPHSPNSGEEAYPMLHFASLTPNIYNFMEYKIGSEVKDGRVKVPQEPGLGKLKNEETLLKNN